MKHSSPSVSRRATEILFCHKFRFYSHYLRLTGSVSSEHYVGTSQPIWIRIYIESVCINCFTYHEMDRCISPLCTRLYVCTYMNVCVCVCASFCCHPSGRLVRPPLRVHSIKAAAAAPAAPPCPPLGAPPNLLPGRPHASHLALWSVSQVTSSFSPGPWPIAEDTDVS